MKNILSTCKLERNFLNRSPKDHMSQAYKTNTKSNRVRYTQLLLTYLLIKSSYHTPNIFTLHKFIEKSMFQKPLFLIELLTILIKSNSILNHQKKHDFTDS